MALTSYYNTLYTFIVKDNKTLVLRVVPMSVLNIDNVIQFVSNDHANISMYNTLKVNSKVLANEKFAKICADNVINRLGSVFVDYYTNKIIAVLTFQYVSKNVTYECENKSLNYIENVISSARKSHESYRKDHNTICLQSLSITKDYDNTELLRYLLDISLNDHTIVRKSPYILAEALNERTLHVLQSCGFTLTSKLELQAGIGEFVYSVVLDRIKNNTVHKMLKYIRPML